MEQLIHSGRAWAFNANDFLVKPDFFEYISPTYEIPDSGLLQRSPYIVVSAPGAVGKSAFGLHLARTKNAMLWNLSRLRLGSNTFVGSVLRAVGASQLPEFLASIAKGETTLVFDAIDEAELHSGWSGVQDFLQEVIACTGEAAAGSVIFLARRDTAEMVALALSDLLPENRSFATASIRFFSKENAIKFILAQIERHKGREFLNRNRHVLLGKAAEAIAMPVAGEVASALGQSWRSPEQERFFGYAPVLQTIAKLLAESDNPYSLSFEQSRSGYAAIVAEILELILDRERAKVLDAISQRFAAERDLDVDSVYTRDDQQRRILGLLTSDDAEAYSSPDGIKQQLAVELNEMLRSFLPQHPFLDRGAFAGPAFRDFVLARGLTDGTRRLACELWIESTQPLYTPILASLYHAAASGYADAADTELLYESANAGAVHGQSELLLFISEEESETLSIEIASDDTDPLGENLKFHAGNLGNIRFMRRLNNAQIIVPSTLVFGQKDQTFEFSDSEVSAHQILFETSRIRVHSETGGVTHLKSDLPVHAPAALKLEVQAPAGLAVTWPNSRVYPWTPYSAEATLNDITVDVATTLHVVARILGWFRKDRRKEYGRYKDLIVKHVVGASPTARYALGFIEHLGALSYSCNLYFIDTDILDSRDISWQRIRNGTVSEKAKAAVEAYLLSTPQAPQF